MAKKDERVPVIFKISHGEVLAVFPTVVGTSSPYTCSCYAHVGQHSSCDAHAAASLRAAKPAEYAALKRELEQIGYKLEIRTRFSQRDLADRKAQVR
jgi:hypothetical protein